MAARGWAGTVVTDDTGGLLALSRSVLRRLACDPSIVRITTRGGLPIDIGRQTRQVSVALRRALQARDDTCRYPGCAATRQLHAHHVVHWADGGPTDHDPVGLQPPGWWGDRLDLDAAVAHLNTRSTASPDSPTPRHPASGARPRLRVDDRTTACRRPDRSTRAPSASTATTPTPLEVRCGLG